jgi:hypothetical protein
MFCVVLCKFDVHVGDSYDDGAYGSNTSSKKQETLGEIDHWESGGPKNIIEEGFDKVKEIINKARGFDEPPEGG